MGIGVSIFLLAVGAIITFATNVEVSGIDLDMVGIILMIAGGVGLLLTLLVFGPRSRRTTAVDDGYADRPRRTIIEE